MAFTADDTRGEALTKLQALETDVDTKATSAALTSGLATKQPLDSDLTAIAALTTTTFGRSILTQADASAARTTLGLGTAAVAASGDFATAGHSHTLDGLSDVTITSATNGQVLKYNGTTWVNGTDSTGGGGGTGAWGDITGTLTDQTDLVAYVAAQLGDTVTVADPGADSFVIWNDTTNVPATLPYTSARAAIGALSDDPVLSQGIDLNPIIEVCTGDGDGSSSPALPVPSDGDYDNILNIPSGSGYIAKLNITFEAGDFGKDGRLAVFYDGAEWPQLYIDFGTYGGTAFGGLTKGNVLKMARWEGSTHGDQETHETACNFVLNYTMPFSNGIRIAIVNDGVTDIQGGGDGTSSAYFSHVDVRFTDEPASPYQLQSACQPASNPLNLGLTDPALYFRWDNDAEGAIVYRSLAMQGATSRRFLEKNNYFAFGAEVGNVDMDGTGDPIATTLGGVVLTNGASFAGNGTEDDITDTGYYGMDKAYFAGPYTWMSVNDITANGSGKYAYCAGQDFIGLKRGIPFSGGVEGGKGYSGTDTLEECAHCHLIYIDTSVPQAPSSPELELISVGDGSVTLKLDTMRMTQGSSPVTIFNGSYTGPTSGSFVFDNGATEVTITGLTNGEVYTFTCTATNAVGTSSASTAITGTPSDGSTLAPEAYGTLTFYANADLEAYADNASVATINDQSGNNMDATATGGNEALFKTNIFGDKSAYRFTAAGGDKLSTANFTLGNQCTLFVVFKKRSSSPNFARVVEIGENEHFTLANSADDSEFTFQHGLSTNDSATVSNGTVYIAAFRHNGAGGANSYVSLLNGVSVGSGTSSSFTTGTLKLNIGNRGTGNDLAGNYDIGCVIYYGGAVLSDANMDSLGAELAAYYGGTWTP